jgi:multicomponent Na+:H+ antiporter subunit E
VTFFVWNIALAVVWMALWGFSPMNFGLGFFLGYLLMSITRRIFPPTSYFGKVRQIAVFIAFFLQELITANIQIARMVLAIRPALHPSIVAIPLDAESDVEITLIANLISLTPGTLSLELSPDRRLLYVHGMDVRDSQEFIEKVKDGLEARALEVIR